MLKKWLVPFSIIINIAITAVALFALNNGMAQTADDKIRNIYLDNIERLTVEALNDSSINIALCEVPDDPYLHSPLKVVFDSGIVKRYSGSPPLGLMRIEIRDLLRGNDNIDSLINVDESLGILREGMENQYPLVNLAPGSVWIMFLDSPFLMSRWYHAEVLKDLEKYENKLEGQVDLNSNNFFALYEWDAGALCTYFPDDAKYPPMFIFSEELVDDFKTIIELQENPSLLSESSNSYENYYNSMKEELSRRVFSRLFDNPNQE